MDRSRFYTFRKEPTRMLTLGIDKESKREDMQESINSVKYINDELGTILVI